MHFLMPHIFRSRREFSYWFSQPLTGMVEGGRSVSGDLISRLHSVMRPFLLRRLKKEVAKQLPAKVRLC
jgi:SNF2 family DNA or RNA helicase